MKDSGCISDHIYTSSGIRSTGREVATVFEHCETCLVFLQNYIAHVVDYATEAWKKTGSNPVNAPLKNSAKTYFLTAPIFLCIVTIHLILNLFNL